MGVSSRSCMTEKWLNETGACLAQYNSIWKRLGRDAFPAVIIQSRGKLAIAQSLLSFKQDMR